MITLWRKRPLLTSAFLLACAATLFFSGRFVVQAVYWANHQEEPVRPWMTVAYVARSWGLEPLALNTEAGFPMPEVKGHPQPLSEIARDRGVPVEDLIANLETAIATLNARQGGAEE